LTLLSTNLPFEKKRRYLNSLLVIFAIAVDMMGSACRFALFGTLLYASSTFGMQSPSSGTESHSDIAVAVYRALKLATVHSQLQRPLELGLPGSRAPFLPPTIAPHERPPELSPAGPSYVAAGPSDPLAIFHSQIQRPLELVPPSPSAPFLPPAIALLEKPPELDPASPSYAGAGPSDTAGPSIAATGPSDPSLRTTQNPASDQGVDCQVSGELSPTGTRTPQSDRCNVSRCQNAGGVCVQGLNFERLCVQRVRLSKNGLLERRSWTEVASVERACEHCYCVSVDRAVAPSLPAIHRPDQAICQFAGSLCNIVRCIDAGGGCGKSYYRDAMNCAQKVRLATGHMIKKFWSSSESTRTACQSCKCTLRRPVSGLKKSSPSVKPTCKMYSMPGVTCSTDDCEGAGGSCILEEPYNHCFLKTPERNVPAACEKCRCIRKYRL
jgi:hypothetical protein